MGKNGLKMGVWLSFFYKFAENREFFQGRFLPYKLGIETPVARREKSLEYRHGRIFPFEYRHGRTRSLITKEDHNQTMPTAKRSFRELDVTEQNETMKK